MFGRKQLAIAVAEFLGTGVLALVILSVGHSTIGLPYFVGIAAGLSLATMMIALSGNGGTHFNPAVTIGMWTIRQIKTLPAIVYIVAQLLGAWAAYALYTYFIKTPLQPMTSHYDGHVLVAEAVATFILSLAFAAAVFGKYASAKMGAIVGAAYVLGVVIASTVSLGIANPAVAVSLRALDLTGSTGWGTYALGPVLGGVIGFNLYALLFAPESSLLRVRAVVSERWSARSSTTTAAVEMKPAAKPAAKRSATRSAKPKARRTRK